MAGSPPSCQSCPVIRLEWARARWDGEPSSKPWLRPQGGSREPLPQDFCSREDLRPRLPQGRSLSLARASSVKRGPQLLPLGSHRLQAPGHLCEPGMALAAQPRNVSSPDHSEIRPGSQWSLSQNCPAQGGHGGPSPGPCRECVPGERLLRDADARAGRGRPGRRPGAVVRALAWLPLSQT